MGDCAERMGRAAVVPPTAPLAKGESLMKQSLRPSKLATDPSHTAKWLQNVRPPPGRVA